MDSFRNCHFWFAICYLCWIFPHLATGSFSGHIVEWYCRGEELITAGLISRLVAVFLLDFLQSWHDASLLSISGISPTCSPPLVLLGSEDLILVHVTSVSI